MASNKQHETRYQNFSDQLLGLILRLRWWIITCVLGLTMLAFLTVLSTDFTSSLAESFVDTTDEYESAIALEQWFSGNPDSLVYVGANEGDELWSSSKLLEIRRASEELSRLPAIKSVVTIADMTVFDFERRGLRATIRRSVLNAQLKKGTLPEHLPTVETVLPKRVSERDDWNDAKLEKLTHWLAKRSAFAEPMISRDRRSHLMLIEISNLHQLSLHDQDHLLSDIRFILEQHHIGVHELHLSGLLTLQAASVEQISFMLLKLLPVGAIAIAVLVLGLFRRIEPILMVMFIAAIAVLWGIGFGEWRYGNFSVLTMAVPLMVIVISTGDVIHLVSAYGTDLTENCTHDMALRKTFREMSSVCTLTSLTTFVGFASLALVPSQTIRQFGISAAVGVASALILSVIFVPIFLEMLHDAGWTLRVRCSEASRTLRFAIGVAHTGIRYPRLVAVLSATILILGLCFAIRLHLDPDFHHRFRKPHPVAQSTEFFTQQFGGVNSIEIALSGDSRELLAPETLQSILNLSKSLQSDLPVSRVDSIAGEIAKLLTSLDATRPTRVPETLEHSMGIVKLAEQVDARVVSTFLTPDHRGLRIVAQVPATSSLELHRLSTEVIERARREFPPSITICEKGSAPIVGKAVKKIITGHMFGFGVSFLMIVLLISVGLRSLRLGLLAVPPNLIPLVSLGGLLGWTSPVADSDILAVATLGLGLTVDDTIHFLSRYQREFFLAPNFTAAIEATIRHTGIAIVRTTAILLVGFLPFAASDYWSITMLGTYLVMILAIALFADLLLLPSLLRLFGPRKLLC